MNTITDQFDPAWFSRSEAGKEAIAPPPLEKIRELIAEALAPCTEVPPERAVAFFHIRCVNTVKVGDKIESSVIFTPEFCITLDVGWEMRPAVYLYWKTHGMGDPTFPDFCSAKLFSLVSWDLGRVLFPYIAGELIIDSVPGVPPNQVADDLKPYVSSLEPVVENVYRARVKAFHEPAVAREIKEKVGVVVSANPTGFRRPIGHSPGWLVDRLL